MMVVQCGKLEENIRAPHKFLHKTSIGCENHGGLRVGGDKL